MPYTDFDALANDVTGPARRLQILAVDRYAQDFDVTPEVTKAAALLLAGSIDDFAEHLAADKPVPLTALGIVDLAHCLWAQIKDGKFRFSRALRVAEDIYQRTRLACLSATAADFNRTLVDGYGVPSTLVTDISRYSRFYGLRLSDVAAVNRWLVAVERTLHEKDASAALVIPPEIRKLRPREWCQKPEETFKRRTELHEDLYQRWRNLLYKPINMVRLEAKDIDKNTLLAVHHRRLNGQHVDAFMAGTAVDVRGTPNPLKTSAFLAASA